MAEVAPSSEFTSIGNKRKPGKKKGKMAKKRQRTMPQGSQNKAKIDPKMRKLFKKRARDYNSDGEDEDERPQQQSTDRAVGSNSFVKKDNFVKKDSFVKRDNFVKKDSFLKRDGDDGFEGGCPDDGEEENEEGSDAEEGVSEDEGGGIQPGITRFSEGIKAFKLAFKKIVKKSGGGGDEDVLDPVLSANKKLLAEKLAEEEEDKKVKGEVKKEKRLIGEKGHVKVANYLDAHEKFLLGVATKGVVKLFNAVNKAQNAQKGLNPSRSKDEKVIKKRRKEVFFSELGKTQSAGTGLKVGSSGGSVDGEAPGWAPLRDNYMLTNPKLKDWDKMQDTNEEEDFGRQSDAESSSSEDD